MRSSPDVATEAATRQSHSGRSFDQCPRQCRRGSLEVVAGSFPNSLPTFHQLARDWTRATKFIERAKKRFAKADENLLKLQTERAQLATELAEGQARFEALRAEAGAVPPIPGAPKDVDSELQRMQGVIDDLLRERSEWMVARQGEVKIPMDLGTLVATRSARDDAGSKRLRVEGRSSSVCVREGVPPDTV